jgi:hypothetical protein
MSGIIESSMTGGAPEPDPVQPRNTETGWAAWIVFAGWMLILEGCFHLLHGWVALFHDEIYQVRETGLVIITSFTAWGWVHLIGGAIAIVAGVALQRGRLWARTVAVVVAFLSALVNMAFVPAYPVWSAIMIALDVVIIWAVTVHGSVMKEPAMPR